MGLDVNTPRGQETLADEAKAAAIFEHHYPECLYINTPKGTRADVDTMVTNVGKRLIASVGETKCRYDVTLEQFRTDYSNDWLVTFDKVVRGIRIAEACCVPYYGFLYIVKDGALLAKRIWRPGHGLEVERMVVRKTKTQATVNGGEALRDNAFINMDDCIGPLYLP